MQPGARGLPVTTISGKALERLEDRMGDDVLHELLSPRNGAAFTNIRRVANAIEQGWARRGRALYLDYGAECATFKPSLAAWGCSPAP